VVVHHRTVLRDAQVSGRPSPPKPKGGADYVVVMGETHLPMTVAEAGFESRPEA
jgi:hypothetical protein